MKCGYVALLGQPNAGKSTLMNALVGTKLAGVSKKAQTTRNKIVGLYLDEEQAAQVAFLDTPGIHNDKKLVEMNKMMNDIAWRVASDADIICYLIDITKKWDQFDKQFLSRLIPKVDNKPFYILFTKTDLVKKNEIKEQRSRFKEEINEIYKELDLPSDNRVIQTLSAKRPEEVSTFAKKIAGLVPSGPWLYSAEDLSDKSEKFFISEYIREQVFRKLGKELPYGIGVTVDEVKDRPNAVSIKATIVVSRDSHKGIVIGKRGAMIKQLGIDSRKTIEDYYDKKVHLELFVSVKEGWTERKDMVAQIQDLDFD